MQDSEIIKRLSEAMLKNHESHWALISRVQNKEPWTGEGLPPVGVPLEYQRRGAPNGKWYPTQINFLSGQHVIFCDSDGDEIRENPGDILFRPTRTPEQIAAEERERAIDEMCQAAEERITDEVAALIYDAGYRKA